jgi:hypothetical protein
MYCTWCTCTGPITGRETPVESLFWARARDLSGNVAIPITLGIGNFSRKIKLKNFEEPMMDLDFSTQEPLIKLHKISLLSENRLFLMKKLSLNFSQKITNTNTPNIVWVLLHP